MGLTKQYLRYVAGAVFGIIGSPKANVVYFDGQKKCAVGACEHVLIWDIKTGVVVNKFFGDKSEVSVISASPDNKHIAVGYADGKINIFDVETGENVIVFSGHKSAVTALNYDHIGVQLVSGSRDTDVIVWDIVNEAGLYRLKGHKGQITQARFLKQRDLLITSSKDTFVKFWDLSTQHCFKTLVGHRTEVWDFVITPEERRLVTGSGDNELRLWDLQYIDDSLEETSNNDSNDEPTKKKAKIESGESDDENEDEEEERILTCEKIGSLLRHGKDRVVNLKLDQTGSILACHGTDKMMEVFKINSKEEAKKSLMRRQKRIRKQNRETGQEEEIPTEENIDDMIRRAGSVTASGKLRGFDIKTNKAKVTKMVCLLSNNIVEVLNVEMTGKTIDGSSATKLTLHGHRSDVRTVAFSSDNTAIVSASAESVKIWNRASTQCIRSVSCDYALCSMFAPGDRHVIIGTKTGKIQIFDISSGSLLESISAHSGAVWSMHMAPDKRGIVSGSADRDVKFWNFELVTDAQETSKRLTLVNTRTLKMSEDVLCVKFSPNQRLLAVSLLDNTVKVFFTDTLKFFLSLYGHKLPVLSMDISSDSSLLVTGSADRNVKLWGLDFGDCHKSIFAHDDSIMCLQFIANTHMFFSGGKDGKVKQWDGDIFEHIITLTGHHAEIWCLAVSNNGKYVVTGSHDKSLRFWEKTQEPVVLEEEREMEREKEYEDAAGENQPVVPGETNNEVGMAGRKTLETVKSAEKLMEALELYKEENAKLDEHAMECKLSKKEIAPPPLHPLFMAYKVTTPSKYVLMVLKKIKSSELEESLLVLPFSYVIDLLEILHHFLEQSWEPELTCRCLLFLLKVHHGQITSSQILLPVIDKLRSQTPKQVNYVKDVIGFNMAGLQFIKQQIEEKEETIFFADATGESRKKKRKQKKKVLLTLKT
ncbi:WD repeat-containing protein 3-like [Tubulanus polymorphus]|uniref:WD repeat-containing protein 3-like n=1 Tax=Tubulanus polymorphus TaxID=672921 RepID=UPI003DA498BE